MLLPIYCLYYLWLSGSGVVFLDSKENYWNREPRASSQRQQFARLLFMGVGLCASAEKVTTCLSSSSRRSIRNELPWKRSWSSYAL